MAGQIRAEVCDKCKGLGGNPKTGKACEYCMGAGVIGKDGENEYYLRPNKSGQLQVAGIKSTSQKVRPGAEKSQEQASRQDVAHVQSQRKLIIKGFLVIALIIAYVVLWALNLAFIKDQKVVVVGTIVGVGFLFLILIYDTSFSDIFGKVFGLIFVKEPDDFMKAAKERRRA